MVLAGITGDDLAFRFGDRLTDERVQRQHEENAVLRGELERTRLDLKALRQVVEKALGKKAA